MRASESIGGRVLGFVWARCKSGERVGVRKEKFSLVIDAER